MASERMVDHEIQVGEFRIEPHKGDKVWIWDADGRGGTFPEEEVAQVIGEEDALREYFNKNFA